MIATLPREIVAEMACPTCHAMGSCFIVGQTPVGRQAECANCGQTDLIVGQIFTWNFDGEQRGNWNLAWHVTNAKIYLFEHPRSPILIEHRVLAHMAEANQRPDWYRSHEYAMSTDLSEPLLIIRNPRRLIVAALPPAR